MVDAYIDGWEDCAEKAKKYARLSSTVILVTVSSSLLCKLEQREKNIHNNWSNIWLVWKGWHMVSL